MPDTKKYYYLRLKDNFFQSSNVRYLETMKNGYEYIVLLLKLQLLSINENGRLAIGDRPYTPLQLARRSNLFKEQSRFSKSWGCLRCKATGQFMFLIFRTLLENPRARQTVSASISGRRKRTRHLVRNRVRFLTAFLHQSIEQRA